MEQVFLNHLLLFEGGDHTLSQIDNYLYFEQTSTATLPYLS